MERSTPLKAVAPALKACLSSSSAVQVQVKSPHGENWYDEDGALETSSILVPKSTRVRS